jgi:hypothetical protein
VTATLPAGRQYNAADLIASLTGIHCSSLVLKE